jgi:hypothetical protein
VTDSGRARLAVAASCVAFGGLALLAWRDGPWSARLGSYLALHSLAWGACVLAAGSSLRARTVLAAAVAFRLLLLPVEPSLSDDVYRYVWEGRIQNAGFDPYRSAPAAPELGALHDDVWARVNHPTYTAIYPPLAELVFRLLALAGGVGIFKLAFAAVDVALLALLSRALASRGQPAARLALYAWNPLAVVEVAGSGHFEPLGILPLVAALVLGSARRRPAWAALAASIAAKYAALVVVPSFWRSVPPRKGGLLAALAVLAAAFLPFAASGAHLFDSLRAWSEHWRYNDLLFSLLSLWIADPGRARWTVAGVGALVCVAVALRPGTLERRAMAAVAITLALSPTIHPWYLLWALALVPLAPSAAVVAWSGTIPLAYLLLYPAAGSGPWPAGSWVLLLGEMAPVLGLAAWETWSSRPASRERRP